MEEILKGNFDVKRPVNSEAVIKKSGDVGEELKERALASLGGSMVYVERGTLTWDGETDSNA
ncbi:MAG: hypothetical protein HS115_10395 [Spirochaetales bacterium]|nr:hypothetical protein [Spirochaetales bacterium]